MQYAGGSAARPNPAPTLPSVASRRLEPRLPTPRAYRPVRVSARPSLAQFVFLSMLLHALFILMFGSPVGGSREGRAMWGSLDVTIHGPLTNTGVGPRQDPVAGMSLPGSQLLERRASQRPEAAPPAPVPRPEAQSPPPDLDAAKVADVPVATPLPQDVVVTPATAELVPAPRVEAVKVPAPLLPVPAPVPAIEWAPQQAVEPLLAPPVEVPRPVRVPVITAPSMQPGTTPAASTRLEPSVELVPVATPVAPAPAPSPPPVVEVPAIPAPPMPQGTTSAVAPVLAPPVEIAPPTRPAPAQAPQSGAPARDAPAAPERPVAREPVPATRDTAPSRSDSPIFNNRTPPPTDAPAPGTGPRIDLDAARARARQVAREGSGNRAILPFPMPPAPERKTKEQIAIEKAWKPACKDAYKGLGLLAVIPLVANEFGEGTCRW